MLFFYSQLPVWSVWTCVHVFPPPPEECHTVKGREGKEKEASEDEGIGRRTEQGKGGKRGERCIREKGENLLSALELRTNTKPDPQNPVIS